MSPTAYEWKGSLLSAVFLLTGDIGSAWPAVIDAWAAAGLLDVGKATVLELPVERVTYESVMSGPGSREIAWDRESVFKVLLWLRQRLAVRLLLPLADTPDLEEVRVDVVANPDDSLSVYIEAPYDAVCATGTEGDQARRFRAFLNTSCRFFAPDLFLVGYVGEEARLDSLSDLLRDPDRVADWAFYGRAVVPTLGRGPQNYRAARDWRRVGVSGLFVRWSDWAQGPGAPDFWRDAVRSGLGQVGISQRPAS